MRVHAEVTKAELIGALRDATIDNAAFDVREWTLRDALTLRKIADMLERERNDWLKRWRGSTSPPVVPPTEGKDDLPPTPTP